MIRPIQRLPSILLLLERLLKYTSVTHIDYQLLIDSLDKLRENCIDRLEVFLDRGM